MNLFPRRAARAVLLTIATVLPAQDPTPPPGGFPVVLLANQPIIWSDGYETRMDLYRPGVAPPPTGWPGVLAIHGGGGHRKIPRIVALANYLARQGYVVYAYDVSGDGQTPGLNPGWPTPRGEDRELLDSAESHGAAEAIWAAHLDLLRLALTGTSQGGKHSLQAAAWSGQLLPLTGAVTHYPTVLACAPEIASVDPVAANLPGTLVSDEFVEGLPPTDPRVLLLEVEDYAGMFALSQGTITAQTLPKLQTSTVPLFVMLAWQDWKHQPTVATTALANLTMPRRLFLTTGGHSTPDNAHEEAVQNELRRRWFDRYLKGVANNVEFEPYAELAVDADDPSNTILSSVWEHRPAATWPPNTPNQTLYLRGNGTLSANAPAAIEVGPLLLHRIAPGFTPTDYVQQGAGTAPAALFAQIGKLVSHFVSPPMPEDMEVFGRASVDLEVDDSTGVFQLSVVLSHVDPANNVHPITIGTGGVRTGVSGRQVLHFDLADIAHVVPEGNRLQIVVQNLADHICPSNRRIQYVPYFTETDTEVLLEPGAASRVHLPLRPYAINLRPRLAVASAALGIDHDMQLRGGSARAGMLYLAAIGASGEAPALPLAPGVVVPLVPDAWTSLGLGLANGPAFPGFLGLLDANGDASLAFRIPPAQAPLLLGTNFTFAGVTFAPSGFEAAFGPGKLVLNP